MPNSVCLLSPHWKLGVGAVGFHILGHMALNDSFTFSRLDVVCSFVCVNAHMSAGMCAYTYRPEDNLGCCSSSRASHFVFRDRVSHWNLRLAN